jgi:hypothetical protein
MAGKYKTMTLIEEAELERLRQRQIKEYNPSLRSLAQIQDQIEKLFDDPELTDEGKCKILSLLHERFGALLTQYKNSPAAAAQVPEAKPVQIDIKAQEEPNLDDSSVDEDMENEAKGQAPIVPKIPSLKDANIPTQFAKKFEIFQSFLKDHEDQISSNDQNELILDGQSIKGSSFLDLLRSFYVRNQDMNLIGLQQFQNKLHDINASLDMFSHRETLSTLTHLDKKIKKHNQTGFGYPPPGKRPRFLHVFRY